MKKIGLLSDTHGYIDESILRLLADVDEIWHAGDIGDLRVTNELKKIKPLRAVHGNIDGTTIRAEFPEDQFFETEGLKVLITHIGGSPGNYFPQAREKIKLHQPALFICGHSHILKVMPDAENKLLHMNPGAAGKHGFHKFRTFLRFAIENGKIIRPEAVELGLRGSLD